MLSPLTSRYFFVQPWVRRKFSCRIGRVVKSTIMNEGRTKSCTTNIIAECKPNLEKRTRFGNNLYWSHRQELCYVQISFNPSEFWKYNRVVTVYERLFLADYAFWNICAQLKAHPYVERTCSNKYKKGKSKYATWLIKSWSRDHCLSCGSGSNPFDLDADELLNEFLNILAASLT